MTNSIPSLYIYGSCVSRDMCRLMPERVVSRQYIARQSWISAFSAPTRIPATAFGRTSPFQQRMVELDLASGAPADIAAVAPDATGVLLDLIDERHGVFPTATGYATNSFEMIGSAWRKDLIRGELIAFGSEAHMGLWRKAAVKMRDLLDDEGLFGRTSVVRANYATHTDDGRYLGERRGRPVEEWDSVFEPYYAELERLGFKVLHVSPDLAVTKSDHAWGAEPFHYIDEYYDEMATLVTRRLREAGRID